MSSTAELLPLRIVLKDLWALLAGVEVDSFRQDTGLRRQRLKPPTIRELFGNENPCFSVTEFSKN